MQPTIGNLIVGSWALTSCVDWDANGQSLHFFGSTPSGILMYDEKGHMNVQIMNPERPRFKSDAMGVCTPEEASAAFLGYNAYYGRYSEEQPGEISHVVEGSLFPNFIGIRFIRYATLQDDKLVLKTPPLVVYDKPMTFQLTWQRL